jgi:hypothetical protein
MRFLLMLVSFTVAVLPVGAKACSPTLIPGQLLVTKWAREGVVIRGRVVQALETDKQQPEIIRAEAIYVGDVGLRDFVIYRPTSYLKYVARTHQLPEGDARPFGPCGNPVEFKLGQVFETLLLLPARAHDALANGRWTAQIGPYQVPIDDVMSEAEKLGRLRARPEMKASP